MSSTTFLSLSLERISALKLISVFLNAHETFIAIVLGVVIKIWTAVVQILIINRGYKKHIAACLLSGSGWEFSKFVFYFLKKNGCLLCNLPNKVCLS